MSISYNFSPLCDGGDGGSSEKVSVLISMLRETDFRNLEGIKVAVAAMSAMLVAAMVVGAGGSDGGGGTCECDGSDGRSGEKENIDFP